MAAARRPKSNSPLLPSWVPDRRVPSAYKSEEHKTAVETLLEAVKFENYPATYREWDMQAHQSKLHKSLVTVDGRKLILLGRFVQPNILQTRDGDIPGPFSFDETTQALFLLPRPDIVC